MADTGLALAVAVTAALVALFVVLLGAVVVRHCWRRRDAVASMRRGFVLFDVCFPDDRQRRAARPPSMERSRSRQAGAGGREAAAADDQEPDEFEIAQWKRIFGGPNRSLSTIDEGTEKGGTTPAFCSPPASPDRRDARALDMATIAVQIRPA